MNPKMRAFVDPEQMEWLKKDLESTDKKCIIFSHQSIDTFMNNGKEVHALLAGENKRAGSKRWYWPSADIITATIQRK